MTRRLLTCLTVCTAVVAGASCAGRAPVPELPPEPLAAANTMCFRSLTSGLYRFGDPTVGSLADTSFLVIHGWRDSVFAGIPGPAWVSLADQEWRFDEGEWRRLPGDSAAVTFADSLSYRYLLVFHPDAADGIATALTANPATDTDDDALAWLVWLDRIDCLGLRDRRSAPPS